MIRRYEDGDEEEIGRIYHAAIHRLACADYTREQLEAWSGRAWDPEGWRLRCRRKRPWVREIDGRVAGFMELDPDGHIDCTFVHPDFARQGVMSSLMEVAKREAARHGWARLHAEVSITARPFFERHGFEWRADNRVTIRGVELENYRMEWRAPAGGA